MHSRYHVTSRPPGQARDQRTPHPTPARTVHHPIGRPATNACRRVDWTTWWLWRGARTRSHPELGRENPQRPWYCVLRHGRVGRRQVFQSHPPNPSPITTDAGWSSPVARQAHNLKVIGSNPIPATKIRSKNQYDNSRIRHRPDGIFAYVNFSSARKRSRAEISSNRAETEFHLGLRLTR